MRLHLGGGSAEQHFLVVRSTHKYRVINSLKAAAGQISNNILTPAGSIRCVRTLYDRTIENTDGRMFLLSGLVAVSPTTL